MTRTRKAVEVLDASSGCDERAAKGEHGSSHRDPGSARVFWEGDSVDTRIGAP
jgi:hypothetical protein